MTNFCLNKLMVYGMYKTYFFLIFIISSSVLFSRDFETNVDVIPNGKQESDSLESLAYTEEYIPPMADTSAYVPLTLEEVIKLALENNRNLKTYRLTEETAKIRLKQAEYEFLPSAYMTAGRDETRNDDLGYVIRTTELNSTFGFSRQLETGGSVRLSVNSSSSESSNLPGVTNYNTNVGITLSQPLLRGAGIRVNTIPIERAKDRAKVSFFQVKQNMINLITRLEDIYWDLILDYEDYKIQQQALKRANQLLEVNKSLIESGRMASQEIVQAESDLATREIALAAAENSIITTQVRMQGYLDLSDRIWVRPTTEMEFKPVDIKLEECLARAYENRPDWKIYNLYLDIERMDLIVARNRNRYQLGTNARIGSDADSNIRFLNTMKNAFTFNSLAWTVGLSFSIPFNKRVLQNGFELSRLAYERWLLYVEERRDDIRIDVENAVRHVKFTLKQVGLAKRAKELAEQKLELEEEKMRVGRSTNFQVISYQRDLINAQNAELKAIANYLKALGELQQTMGTTLEYWGIEFEDME